MYQEPRAIELCGSVPYVHQEYTDSTDICQMVNEFARATLQVIVDFNFLVSLTDKLTVTSLWLLQTHCI